MKVYIVYEDFCDDYESASVVVKVFANEYKAMECVDNLNAERVDSKYSYYISEEEVVV